MALVKSYDLKALRRIFDFGDPSPLLGGAVSEPSYTAKPTDPIAKFYWLKLPRRCIITAIGKMTNLLHFRNRQCRRTTQQLLARVRVDSEICAGRPYIRGTRIYVAVILDALTQGLAAAEIIDHYPVLALDDIRAAVAYASQLARHNGGVANLGRN